MKEKKAMREETYHRRGRSLTRVGSNEAWLDELENDVSERKAKGAVNEVEH